MGKYGNGISIRDIITNEVAEVELILKNSNLRSDQKEEIIVAIKEMAYQWCVSNAHSCAIEAAVEKLCPDLDMMKLFHEIIHSGVHEKKMAETYPY